MTRYATHPLWLTFRDPAIERAWRADRAAEMQAWMRPSLLLITLVFAAFAIPDALMYPDRVVELYALRFGGVVPALLAARAALGTAWGRDLALRRPQEIVLGLATVMCGAMAAMAVILLPQASETDVWFAILDHELALLGIYGFSRLRFGYAIGLGFSITLLALALLGTAQSGPSPALMLPFSLAMNLTGAWMTHTHELLERRAFVERAQLAETRRRSEALLHDALPPAIAAQLELGGRAAIAAGYDDVVVVLVDVVGFTPLCERLPPEEIARLLDDLYARFDLLCARFGVEKIKTLGDAWLAAAGVPDPGDDPASAVARLALALRDAAGDGPPLRIGVGSGPAVAGVIGRARFAYDLWGAAVDEATAMERAAVPGGIRLGPGIAARLGERFIVDDADGGWWLRGERREEA